RGNEHAKVMLPETVEVTGRQVVGRYSAAPFCRKCSLASSCRRSRQAELSRGLSRPVQPGHHANLSCCCGERNTIACQNPCAEWTNNPDWVRHSRCPSGVTR